MQTTHHTATVLAYARSLLELAAEQNQAEPIGQELGQIAEVVALNPVFGIYLADPAIGHEERAGFLHKILAGKISPLLWNFLGVVNVKGRLNLITEMSAAYDDLLDEKLGKIEVDVTVAQKLPPEQLEQVRQRVSKVLGKDAVIHQYVDESIIGGLLLRVQDKMIDSSVRSQLNSLKHQLLNSMPK
jgi:F-type H+-transporting ATPase subunit delta